MARKPKLILIGKDKPQLKKASRRDWSKAKAREFLSVLAETCNVSEACRRSGVPMTVAYRRRKSDAVFRAAWLEAIGAAYSRLELVLLDRAFNGTEKVIKRSSGSMPWSAGPSKDRRKRRHRHRQQSGHPTLSAMHRQAPGRECNDPLRPIRAADGASLRRSREWPSMSDPTPFGRPTVAGPGNWASFADRTWFWAGSRWLAAWSPQLPQRQEGPPSMSRRDRQSIRFSPRFASTV